MKTNTFYIKALLTACLIASLLGCVSTPVEVDDLKQDTNRLFIRKVEVSTPTQQIAENYRAPHSQQTNVALPTPELFQTKMSLGDTLQINFAGMPSLSGLYQIDASGHLDLPFSRSLNAAGNTREELIARIKQAMISSQWFYENTADVDVSLVRLAAINVAVLGAVFNPGRVLIDSQPADKPEDTVQNLGGAFSQGRDLVAALGASGGIRPDADVQSVFLTRNNQVFKIDLAAIISGIQFTPTPALQNGDVIYVSSTGIENKQLIRPSQITPPGMRVFMSNLTAPALTNAQSAVGADATRLPYGTSLLDGAISANCVGGTQMANASRSIILITRNYGSTQQLVIKRSINELLANSSNGLINPFLMPNDGVACYDSKFTNFRDVARGIGEVISPIIFGGLL